MKRVVTAGAVVLASLGIVLGTAGTAAAQEPDGIYATKAKCEAVGKGEVFVGGARGYECVHNKKTGKWALYIIA